MTQDQELFELCKEVYKRFGWDEGYKYFYGTTPYAHNTKHSLLDNTSLYTSDYLLEKLPPVIFVRTSDGKNNTAILTVWINGDKTAHVAYMIPFDEQNRGDYARESDTPRKALLKLVIALDDAGVKL